MNEASDSLIQRDRTSVTEVAYILDEQSIAYLSADHKDFLAHVYRGTVDWSHLGAPFDVLLLDDLLEDPSPYRLIIPACVKRKESVDRLISWEKKHGTRIFWNNDVSWYPPLDILAILEAYKQASIHRYIDNGISWANASMVMTHVTKSGRRQVRFRRRCTGAEFFSGETFSAPNGIIDWTFTEKDVAFFILDE